MKGSALLLWSRLLGELVLACMLLAFAHVAPLDLRLALAPALGLGAIVGLGLVVLLGRGLPPPPRVERARIPLVSVKGAVIACGSVAEEVLWRWFAIGALAPVAGIAGAYAASTVGFALAHRGRRHALVHLVTGASFGAVYLATGRLAGAALAHLAYNLGVLLAVESRRVAASTAAPMRVGR